MCESPSVYKAQALIARKPYLCEECGRTIAPGELYAYVWGVWEEYPQAICTCAECFEVREDLLAYLLSVSSAYPEEIYCELSFGNLREKLQEEINASDLPIAA